MGLLSSISSIIDIGSSIAGIVGAGMSAFGDNESYEDTRRQSAYGAELARMLAEGESNPQFAKLVGEEDSRIRNDYIEAIDMYITKNNRQRSRAGGTGSINPERQDEMRSGALMNAFEDSRSKARSSVRELLKASATANSLSIAGFSGTMAAGDRQTAAQSSFFGNVPQLGQDLSKLIGSFGNTNTQPSTGGFAQGTNNTTKQQALKNVWT